MEPRWKALARRPDLQAACGAALLILLNLWLYHNLFRTEFLNDFQSNEGMMAVIGRFLREHPGARWFPLWNAGLPIENSYSLVVPILTAVMSATTGISTLLALHQIAGTVLVLGPAVWAWVAFRWGLPAGAASLGGLALSITTISSILFPQLATDLPRRTDARLIRDVASYGDIAHPAALVLIAWCLLLIYRTIRSGRWGYYGAAIPLAALALLTNGFGMSTLAISGLALVLAFEPAAMPRAAGKGLLIGAWGYLCACGILTPTLLGTISKNSQLVGGDFRFTWRTAAAWVVILAIAGVLERSTRRIAFVERFLVQFTWLFCAILLVFVLTGVAPLPQPERYHLEMNVGLSFLAAAALWRVPRLPRIAIVAALLALAVPQTLRLRQDCRTLLAGVDVRNTFEYRISRWLAEHMPGDRVMAGGTRCSG